MDAREWILGQDSEQKVIFQALDRVDRETETEIFRLSTDAVWRSDSQTTCLAWIARKNLNRIIDQGSLIQPYTSSALMAEALAVREALSQAVNKDWQNLRLASDSQTLIRLINKKIVNNEIYGILQDISILSQFLLCNL
ncbi:unnamed protein product [Arabis nemorensis]|uniref:RNase H type-1 domain-containing protein n=1 Tax=Arabis nemorensis TaxID=586526 RepID=A0A565BGR6_9BRAS|nr:unnamed protein product [Arabis nemorensis]